MPPQRRPYRSHITHEHDDYKHASQRNNNIRTANVRWLTKPRGVTATVTLDPWDSGDLPLLEPLMGDAGVGSVGFCRKLSFGVLADDAAGS
jgi:hypothetical protein